MLRFATHVKPVERRIPARIVETAKIGRLDSTVKSTK